MSATQAPGQWMWGLAQDLYPICRSITGDGVRETLDQMRKLVPLSVHEVPSGTHVFDWTVPNEWNLQRAFIRGPDGGLIADTADHNLHIVSYSEPVSCALTLSELQPHLHSLVGQPDLIPYRTSYYNRSWGFCLTHAEREQLVEGEYQVEVDTCLEPGSLTYGELVIPGESAKEVLIYSHVCHPSLANDNLSGVVTTVGLAQWLLDRECRFTYRFVWGPGTIGSITWLALNRDKVRKIVHGLVAVSLGDAGGYHYKPSRRGNTEIDQIMRYLMASHSGSELDYDPYGYDERQFCSPGFDLPVGRLSRSPHSSYSEYHTSADNLSIISPDSLADSLELLQETVEMIEQNRRYVSLNPHCEPQLGKHGLYRSQGGEALPKANLALLWNMNQADGRTSLLDISNKSGLPFATIAATAQQLADASLLDPEGT